MEIIEQYGEDVKISEIREKLDIAFQKLNLYKNLVDTAVKVSGKNRIEEFKSMDQSLSQGYVSNLQDQCEHCHNKLIDTDTDLLNKRSDEES